MKTNRVAWPSPLKRTEAHERALPFFERLLDGPEHFLAALRAEPVRTPALCAAIMVLEEVSAEEWTRILGKNRRKGS